MDLGWKIPIQITKGEINTRGIGLLETLWKVVEAIIDTILRVSVCLHNILHSFCAGRVTGTAILELNMAQDLASVDQDPFYWPS